MITESWAKSSYSKGGADNCVEVREQADRADIRDTQNRHFGYLSFPAPEWASFLDDVKADRF